MAKQLTISAGGRLVLRESQWTAWRAELSQVSLSAKAQLIVLPDDAPPELWLAAVHGKENS